LQLTSTGLSASLYFAVEVCTGPTLGPGSTGNVGARAGFGRRADNNTET
jgi:hypothetical protein